MQALALFVLQGCLKSEEDDCTEFYRRLDVDKKATQEEIRKAYRKASLANHPDKLAQRGIQVTQEHQEKFVKVNEAYTVLSDVKKRHIYDKVGEDGMKFFDGSIQNDPSILAKNFSKASTSARARIIVFIFVLLLFLLLTPILFCLKIDGSLDGAWMALYIPYWIVNGLLVVNMFIVLTAKNANAEDAHHREEDRDYNEMKSGEEDEENDEMPPMTTQEKVSELSKSSLLILIQLLILLKMDGADYSWFVAFLPLWVYAVSTFYVHFTNYWPIHGIPTEELLTIVKTEMKEQKDEEKKNKEEDEEAQQQSPLEEEEMEEEELTMKACEHILQSKSAFMECLSVLATLVFLLLLACNLEETTDVSYWVVFTPFFVEIGVAALLKFKTDMEAEALVADLNLTDMEDMMFRIFSPEEKGKLMLSNLLQTYSASLLQKVFSNTYVYVMIAVLASGDDDFSSIWVIFPALLFFGCCWCVCCLGVCCVREGFFEEEDEQAYGEEEGEPQPTTAVQESSPVIVVTETMPSDQQQEEQQEAVGVSEVVLTPEQDVEEQAPEQDMEDID